MANNVVGLLKPIKPQAMQITEVRLELLNAIRAEGRIVIKEHEKTVETWKNETPKFEMAIGLAKASGALLLVGPTGNEKGVKKWNWLNEGTKIRWAVMSRDWVSKTIPRWVGSGPGTGHVLIYGKRAMLKRNIAPRPGIKARAWTVLIQKRRLTPFKRAMIDALQRGRGKLFAKQNITE